VQIERGLYGAIVVLGSDEPAFDADRVLVFDDVKLDGDGRIAKTALFDRHSGREGKTLLINGRSEPEYQIAAGQVELWRIVNACSARYVRLSIGGRQVRIIGGSGGLRAEAVTVTETLLAPGERVALAVGPFEDEGAEVAIGSLPYRRTSMKRPRRDVWGTLRIGPRAPSVASIPATLATIEPLVPAGPIVPTRTVRLGARMTLHGHDCLINDETHHHDAPIRVGELQVWQLNARVGLGMPLTLFVSVA
jgi:bilirubin oxidase